MSCFQVQISKHFYIKIHIIEMQHDVRSEFRDNNPKWGRKNIIKEKISANGVRKINLKNPCFKLKLTFFPKKTRQEYHFASAVNVH